MSASDLNDERCSHVAHENGIHELILHDSSDGALDAWMNHLDRIFSQHNPNLLLRTLYTPDVDGVPSVTGLMNRMRALMKRHPVRPIARSAVLYNNANMTRIMNVFAQLANLSGKDEARFFAKSQREEAIEWLLRN